MLKCYGRKKELQILELKEEGQSFFVYGSSGIGKTTLLRQFYESLLKREKVVAGYVHLYPGIDPFSCLFAHQLINLFNNLNLKGRKNDLRDIAASIKSYLAEEMENPVLRNFFLSIRGHIITNGLYEVVRLTDSLHNEENLFELGFDLSLNLKADHLCKIIHAFEMALEDFQLVLILDDFDLIRKEKYDLFKKLISFRPERTHLYFSLSKDNFESLDLEIRKSVPSLELTPLDENGVSEWIVKESPDLLREHSLEDICRVTEGNPFFIASWLKGGLKEELSFSLVDQVLSKYDQKKKHHLISMALTQNPLSTQEYARFFKIDESMAKHYLLEFEEDSLLKSVYLEREGVYSFDHSLKQKRVVSILSSKFDLNQIYQELASYFEDEISYPTEEDMARFFRNISLSLYYYGLIKNKKEEAEEAYHFYKELNALLKEKEFCPSLLGLTQSPYFIKLRTKLKIILYQLLAKCRLDNQDLFKEILNELSKFVYDEVKRMVAQASSLRVSDEFLVEYGKALFYLANWTSKQQKIRETSMIIWFFSSLLDNHPENEEIKIIFAYLLYNLIYDFSSGGEFDGAKDTLNSLKSLLEKNLKLKEIKFIYAEVLAIVSSKLGEEDRFDDSFKYLEDLKSLSKSLEAEVLIEYTKALSNLSFHLGKKKRFQELDRIIKDLSDLTASFPEIIEIKIEYARALVNTSAILSEKGSFKESNNFIKALGTLTVAGETSQEAKNVYFSSLFNLSSDLSAAKRFKDSIGILEKIRELILKEPGNEEILLSYAKTLYNLLHDLGKNKKFNNLISNLSLLKELFNKHSHREIELIYIKSLFNATVDLASAKHYSQIGELLSSSEEMDKKGFRNPASIEIYSKVLFNFSSYLGEGGHFDLMKKSLGLLKELKDSPGTLSFSTSISKMYLDALLNATVHLARAKKFKELSETIEEIGLSSTPIGEGFFALDPETTPDQSRGQIYAKALVNASAHLGKAGHFDELERIIQEVRKLAEVNFNDRRIKLAYLDILVNAVATLRNKDDLTHLWEVVERLKEMNQDSLEDGYGSTAIAYTKSLLVLIDELERQGEMVELNKVMTTLEDLTKKNHQAKAFLKAINFPLF